MTRLLRFIQEHAQEAAGHGADAAEHGSGEFNLGETIMHHLVDAREIELPWGAIHLPSGWYVNLGLSLIHISEPTRPY